MKTYPNLILLAATCFGFASAQAQSPAFPGRAGWSRTSLNSLHAARPETASLGVSQFANKPLRASNQEQLGNVADFLLETQSGKLRYAVVPSGSSASGETYRLVPIAALDAASNNEALVARINREQWDRVGTFTEAELPGRLSLSAEQEQRTAQQFNVAPEAGASNDLTRASKWKGQSVHSGSDLLGTIDDVVVDVPSRAAAALLAPAAGLAANQKLVVPFERLQLTGNGQAPISTTLTRADFQAAQGAFQPTGAPSGQRASGPSTYGPAINAVQLALARDPALAAAGVQVVPETRLVLRGNAQNDAQRQAIENTARQSAPNVAIENQITVQGR
jgi:hypothetical protein